MVRGQFSLGRVVLAAVAVAAFLAGVWRAIIAGSHLMAAHRIDNDPSLRELEQATGWLEALVAVVLLLHAVAVTTLFRRGVTVSPRLVVGLSLYCGVVVAAALLGIEMFRIPGMYPGAIALGAFALAYLPRFSWLSLYLGVVIGGGVAWVIAAPDNDPLACLFVIGPSLIYALAGGWCARKMVKVTP